MAICRQFFKFDGASFDGFHNLRHLWRFAKWAANEMLYMNINVGISTARFANGGMTFINGYWKLRQTV
ncbi:hypothetical protein D9O50_03770 [Oxalobacteraceae bacterium CAVE-383]|nr:hypothetical protein D9O50_03770 [Oxalobacteraceae bacterium CAVE-383]